MASVFSTTYEKAKAVVTSTAENVGETISGQNSKKIQQLASDTKDVNQSGARITSDFGTKQTNTDDWLKVATEDRTGPQLLEDTFGREKVGGKTYYTGKGGKLIVG